MPRIWMVSAEFGIHTDTWVKGGYAAVGWLREEDLTSVDSRVEIVRRYRQANPDETRFEVGAKAGQLARFILEVQPGDYVMTRCQPPTREYRYGIVEDEPLYFVPEPSDGCPFPHRRKVQWSERPIVKANLSIPLQKNLNAAKTLFEVRHVEEFLMAIGEPVEQLESREFETPGIAGSQRRTERQYKMVLDQILKLDPTEFEYLTVALLEAMGYEGADRIGKTGDEGVDVRGTLQSSLVNIELYVQVKHYTNRKVPKSDVLKLYGAIPMDGRGQGAIITTSDFHKAAVTAADDPRFPPVTLINGHQLVDLLNEYWDSEPLRDSPDEDVPSWHERLGLTQGLVLS